MQILLPLPTRVPYWRRRLFALAVMSLLGGCANVDFAEVQPTLVSDDIHDWAGPFAVGGPLVLPPNFELTDDERQLRALANPLIEPPYEHQQWYSIFAEYNLVGADRRKVFDRTAYANHLLSPGYRSPSARYSQLIDDIRNDTTRLPQFFENASRVMDIDRKRQQSMAYVPALSRGERENALQRIRENESIVSHVRAKLAQRVSSYHFALERLVVMTPSPQAVDVERALNQLQAQIARYRGPAPTWVREQNLVTVR